MLELIPLIGLWASIAYRLRMRRTRAFVQLHGYKRFAAALKSMLSPPVTRAKLWILFSLAPLTIVLYLQSTMRFSCVTCATVLSGTLALAATNSTPQALNTTNTNLIAQAPGGPVLYYNGTGDVPGYQLSSPDPTPITPITR